MRTPSDPTGNNGTEPPETAEDLRSLVLGLGRRSHQKSYYSQLQKQFERLEEISLLLDYNPDLMFLVNLRDMALRGLNHAAKERLVDPTAPEQTILLKQVVSDPSCEIIKNWLHDPDSGVSIRFETKLIAADGEKFPVELTAIRKQERDGDILLFICRDISARELAQQQQQRLTFALEQIKDVLLIIDHDWTIQYANQSVSKITGFSPSEILHRPYNGLLDDHLNPSIHREIEATLREGRIFQREIQNTSKEGRAYTLSLSMYPIVDPKNEFDCYLMVGADVTNERETQKRLQQSQKMDALGILAGGVAHDFNNILSIILGFSEILLTFEELDADIAKYVQEIQSAGDRARELVKQILTFSRKSEYSRKPVQVNLIAKEALKMLRATLPSSVDIRRSLQTEALVLADPTHIHQIIMNLVTNAFHALPDNQGVIEVNLAITACDDLPAEARSSLQPGDYVTLTISDTGMGVPQEVRDRIFEPYFTTKEVGQGTGLGLSIVHGIVRDCNGHIQLDSQTGVGTTFTLYFPEYAVSETEMYIDELKLKPLGDETVLLVDDEDAIIRLLQKGLSALGYTVVPASNGEEALREFAAAPERFDIIVTDLTMPRMTGDQFATAVRELDRRIPIILCSGYSEDVTPFRLQKAQFSEVVTKPVRPTSLAEIIRNHLD